MTTTEEGQSFLEHYGVKGMRWGVRKKRSERDRAKSFGGKGKGEKDSIKNLTDTELRQILNRMQMEQQYASLTSAGRGSRSAAMSAGADFAKSIAVNVARQQIQNQLNAQIAKALSSRKSD